MPASISIDNYLDAHQGDAELELCGKLAIVKSILDAEGGSHLKQVERHDERFDPKRLDDTWYLKFLRLLTEGVRRADVGSIFDNVSIIVFNYDRCVERYLLQALRGYYDLSDDEAVKVVAGLRIYHPYGQVGPLPWQERNGVPYGAEGADILSIARGIKTFTEGQDDEGVMTPILQVMSGAETVVFLGFAYHQQNLDLITPPTSIASRVFGTAHGISNSDQKAVTASLKQMLEPVDCGDVEVNLHVSKCAGLFDEFWRSLSAPAPHRD